MNRLWQVVVKWSLALLLAAASSEVNHAEEPAADGWQPIFLSMAEAYQIQTNQDTAVPFELRPSPVLRWSQPVRGGDDGAIFAWMERGRPAVIGTIFAYPNADQTRTVVHEFHSLAREPMTAKWQGRTMLHPSQPGIELRAISGAPTPADKPAARLSQMRKLCREFSARSVDSRQQPWELRLLPQPLVRYQTQDDDPAFDGAVFAFAQGTDPEILLVIEAQRDPIGGTSWKFGCGRFSDYELEVRHHDQSVWKVDRWDFSRLNDVYFASSVETRKAPAGATRLKNRTPVDAKDTETSP